jgi:hypothetical protein
MKKPENEIFTHPFGCSSKQTKKQKNMKVTKRILDSHLDTVFHQHGISKENISAKLWILEPILLLGELQQTTYVGIRIQ